MLRVVSQELNMPVEGVAAFIHKQGKHEKIGLTNSAGEIDLTGYEGMTIQLSRENFTNRILELSSNPKSEDISVVKLLGDTPIGFLDRLDYYPGSKVTLFAHLPVAAIARIVRHGVKLYEVMEIGVLDPVLQNPNDEADVVLEGLDWEEVMTYTIPTELYGGLYSLELSSTEGGKVYQNIPLIVNTSRERRGKISRLLVMASNTTWQSYNIYGGRSRYRKNIGIKPLQFKKRPHPLKIVLTKAARYILPVSLKRRIIERPQFKEPNLAWKFDRLSIRRPFTHVGLEGKDPKLPFLNHLGAGEWRLLAWLEREGIAYDYCSGTALHSEDDLLGKYDGIVFSTHCEYWSKEMFEKVKAAHKAGLWIVNASGNTMYRQIEFDKDGSTQCVSLSFYSSYADETELTGGRFDSLDYGTAAPYKVIEPDHWIFSSLNLKKGDEIGLQSLNCNTPPPNKRYNPGRIGHPDGLKGIGASGWECDKVPKNRKSDFQIVAKGKNPQGGAEMVIKEPQGGAGGIFSAASITYSGALLIDQNLSVMLKNVLHKIIR